MIKTVGHRFGIDIRIHRPASDRRMAMLRRHGIEVVVDIGANAGQYGRELRGSGYEGEIVSFEPLSEAFAALAREASDDECWRCVNVGLGEREETAEIYVAGNSASSSILPMNEQHVEAMPEARYVAKERVRVARLDSIDLALDGRPTLLKLDVQGYELSVLRGACDTLSHVTLLEVELSIVPLYAGQPLIADMLSALDAAGFCLISLEPGFKDQRTGGILQMDGMFVRSEAGIGAGMATASGQGSVEATTA